MSHFSNLQSGKVINNRKHSNACYRFFFATCNLRQKEEWTINVNGNPTKHFYMLVKVLVHVRYYWLYLIMYCICNEFVDFPQTIWFLWCDRLNNIYIEILKIYQENCQNISSQWRVLYFTIISNCSHWTLSLLFIYELKYYIYQHFILNVIYILY